MDLMEISKALLLNMMPFVFLIGVIAGMVIEHYIERRHH